MRLIAQRLLPADSGEVFVDREIINQPLRPLMAPSLGCTHHVYCSVLNPGANELVKELANKVGWQVDTQGLQVDEPTRGSLHRDSHHQESRRKSSMRSSVSGLLASRKQGGVLYVTSDVAKMQACEHVLIYLTSQTWTRGELSEQLGAEINQAMDLELSIKLAHEMPGLGGQHSRHGCEFGTFFASPNGATPPQLLQRGIYSEIAVPLKGGAWREASLVLLGAAIGLTKEEEEAAAEGDDVLGLASETSTSLKIKSFARGLRLSSMSRSMGMRRIARPSLRKANGRRATPAEVKVDAAHHPPSLDDEEFLEI